MTATALALIGFTAWTLALITTLVTIRVGMVLTGKMRANAFAPDNAGLSPFMQRLARAHANCLENLPLVGILLLYALLTGRTAVTDPFAPALLYARLAQSITHLVSTNCFAVQVRFTFFLIQLGILLYYAVQFLLP